MTTVTVYGASDDLVEVEGTMHEEFSYQGGDLNEYDNPGDLLTFSDGTILRIRYTSVWRIEIVCHGIHTEITHEACPEDDDDNYSDRVTLSAQLDMVPVTFSWVVRGDSYARAENVAAR